MKTIAQTYTDNDIEVTFQYIGASTHIEIPAVGSVMTFDGREGKITAVSTNQLPDGSWPSGEWPTLTIAGKRITDRS
jgi:hypothetical protein